MPVLPSPSPLAPWPQAGPLVSQAVSWRRRLNEEAGVLGSCWVDALLPLTDKGWVVMCGSFFLN